MRNLLLRFISNISSKIQSQTLQENSERLDHKFIEYLNRQENHLKSLSNSFELTSQEKSDFGNHSTNSQSRPFQPRTVPTKFIDQQVQSGVRNWQEAWQNFRKIADGKTSHTFGELSCFLSKERKYDSMNDQYTAELGNTYTVERYMPVPYDLTINVDVWCSNTEQKLQLLEQVLTLFNPTVELQANTNPLDWTNITVVELIDIQWSSRSVPQGVDTQLDIATLIFQVPIWINPPAKVKKQTIINQIINRIHLDESMDDLVYDKNMADFFDQFGTLEEIVITPQDAQISVQGNTVSLLSSTGVNENYAWKEFFEQYGEFQAGTSKLKLRRSSNLEDSTSFQTSSVPINFLGI